MNSKIHFHVTLVHMMLYKYKQHWKFSKGTAIHVLQVLFLPKFYFDFKILTNLGWFEDRGLLGLCLGACLLLDLLELLLGLAEDLLGEAPANKLLLLVRLAAPNLHPARLCHNLVLRQRFMSISLTSSKSLQ